MPNSSRFLVITAKTDESQFEDLLISLSQQVKVVIQHKVITGLDSISAEKEVYRLAQTYCFENDFIIKLDADMILLNPHFLGMIVKFFEANPSFNRISLPVEDFYTGRQIMAVHSFRANSVPENVVISAPYPDKWIDSIFGLTIISTPVQLVSHGYSPGIEQSVRFGVHRAIKAMAGGARHLHWQTLADLYKNWRANFSQVELTYAYFSAIEVIENYSMLEWSVVDSSASRNKRFVEAIHLKVELWLLNGKRVESVPSLFHCYRKNFPAITVLFQFHAKRLIWSFRKVRGRYLWYKYWSRTHILKSG